VLAADGRLFAMRLFVGTWPPPKVQRQLIDYPRPELSGLRWSTPSQWLVVIRPLGHVPDALVEPLITALHDGLDGVPTVTASVGTPRHGEWVQAPVSGLEELLEVVFEATEPLVPVTHPHNPWSAHLVLARGRTKGFELAPLAASWTVRSVVVAKAARTDEGPGYDDVAALPLGK